MTDAQFLAAFEAGELPEADFDHAGHVRAAWLYLQQGSFPEALARMSAALRNYTAAQGKPDRYHETITVAYLAVINERLRLRGDGGDWPAFIAQNRELLDRRLLSHYYRPETLASAAARRVFILGEYRDLPYAGRRHPDAGSAATGAKTRRSRRPSASSGEPPGRL